MNSSQKRKLVWVIIGIVVLILFMSVAPKRKDLKFSPLRSMLPGTNPISTEDMIPNTDDSWTQKVLDRMRERLKRPDPVLLPGTITTCNPSNDGYVYDCSTGPHQETEGSVCACENGKCSTVKRTCKDNNDGNLVCKTGPKGTGICLSVLIS